MCICIILLTKVNTYGYYIHHLHLDCFHLIIPFRNHIIPYHAFLFFLFKLYFIDYAITVLLIFPLCPPLHPAPPTPSGNPHTIVHAHGSCVQVLWLLHFLYCTFHSCGCSVTTYLYSLSPSPLHPFPHPRLSIRQPSKHSLYPRHDSVPVLICLVYFLDSTMDRFVFYCS